MTNKHVVKLGYYIASIAKQGPEIWKVNDLDNYIRDTRRLYTKLKSKCISAIATQRSLRWSLIYYVWSLYRKKCWSTCMVTGADQDVHWPPRSWRAGKKGFFSISSRSRLRRSIFAANNNKKNPSGTQGIRGHAAPENFLDFNSLKSPSISWDPKSFKQDIGQFHSPRIKPCNLESFFFIKNISIM